MKYTPDFSSRFRILKGGKISLVVSALVAGSTMTFASPTGGQVTSGSAAIAQNGSITTINQSSNKASINWNSFSIAPSETVNFVQPSSSSVTLNRVIGTTQSLIQGAMNANGQVFLLNPNGVLFANGSQINVGGLVASTLNITDENFQSGNYLFEGNSQNSIINMGTITANNGYVAMMGKTVENEGTIVATMGNVQMASGEKISLNLNGNSLVKLTIDQGTLNALVENKGLIQADGGQVYLTTQALNTILDGMVNNTGVIEAQSLNNVDGKVILYAHGGTTNVSGTIDASGGFIETSGEKLGVANATVIKAKKWLLDPTDIRIDATGGTDLGGSSINVATINTALNAGTSVALSATNDITLYDVIDKSSGGIDTTLELNAGHDIVFGFTPANPDAQTPDAYGKILQTGNPTGNLFVNLFAGNRLTMSDVGNEINVKGDVNIAAAQGFYLRNITSSEGSIFANMSSTIIQGTNGSTVNGAVFGKNGVTLVANADTDNALTIAAGSSIDTTDGRVLLKGIATTGYKALTIEGNSEVPTNIGLHSSEVFLTGYTPGFASGIELGTLNVGNSNSRIYLEAGGHAANGDSIVFQPGSTQNFQALSMSISSNQTMYINSSLSAYGSEFVLSDITKFTTLVPSATLDIGNDYYGHNTLNIGNTIDLSMGSHSKLTFYGANATDVMVGDSAGGAILLQGTEDKPISIFKLQGGDIVFGETSTPSATTTLTLNHVDAEIWGDYTGLMMIAASNDIKILNSILYSGAALMAATNDSITVDGSTLSVNNSQFGAIILASNMDDNGGAIVVNNSTIKSTSDVGFIAMSGGSAFSVNDLFTGTGSGYAKGIDAAGYTNGVTINNSTIGDSTKNTFISIQGESASVGHDVAGNSEYYLATDLDLTSNVANGVLISGASALYSGTADLSISGKMAAQTDAGSQVYGAGVFIMGNTNKTTLNSTTGNITITGDATSVTGHTNASAWFKGVDLQNASLLSTSGNIFLDGKTSAQGQIYVGTEGVDLDGVTITTGGNLSINAISGGGSSAFRTLTQWGNNFITANSLDLTTSNSWANNDKSSVDTMNVFGHDGWFDNTNDVWRLGEFLYVESSANGAGVNIESKLVVGGRTILNVSSVYGDTYLENAANEIHDLRVMDTRFLSLVTTQALDVLSLSSRGDVYLQSGSDININGAVSIGANSAAFFIADSAHGGKFTVADGVSNIQLGEGSKYYIYSSSPSATQLGSYAPDFSVYEKSYANYSNPMLSSGVVYFGAAEVTPEPKPTQQHNPIEDVVTTIVNQSVVVPQNITPLSSPLIQQHSPLMQMALTTLLPSQNGDNFSLVSTTDGNGFLQLLSMNDIQRSLPTGSEIRVPLGHDSVVELINGGVNLPDGVSQEFYVVDNNNKKFKKN